MTLRPDASNGRFRIKCLPSPPVRLFHKQPCKRRIEVVAALQNRLDTQGLSWCLVGVYLTFKALLFANLHYYLDQAEEGQQYKRQRKDHHCQCQQRLVAHAGYPAKKQQKGGERSDECADDAKRTEQE